MIDPFATPQFGFVQSNTHILEEPHGLSKEISIQMPSIMYTKDY